MVSVLISSEIFSSLLTQDSDNITTNNKTKTFLIDDFFLKISSKLNKFYVKNHFSTFQIGLIDEKNRLTLNLSD